VALVFIGIYGACLYCFYTDYNFFVGLQKLKKDEIKEVPLEYCTLHLIPLDKQTIRFYDRLENKNRETIKRIMIK
jgi:hypothetical protein